MDDSKTRDAAEAQPDSEASSKETLADLEQAEKVSDASSEDSSGGSGSPSPDGSLDESDEIKDAGPV